MTNAANNKTGTVQSLERALNLIDILSDHSDGYCIKELADASDLHKSTVHRLLQTLRANGFVYQDARTERYHLGAKILELSARMMEGFDIRTIARPVLEELCAFTGEAVHLFMLDGLDAVYIDKLDNANKTIRMYSQIGKRIPIYCSAAGKVLVAWMNDSELEQLIGRIQFSKKTDQTIMDAKSLIATIAEVRTCGYAVDWFEHEDSIFCLAAPIFDREKLVVAAISVSAAIWDLSYETFSKMREEVWRASKRVSKYLGCGDYPSSFSPSEKDRERIEAFRS